MKKIFILFLTLLIILVTVDGSAQNHFVGKWKAIDDLTGKPLAIIEVFEKNEKLYGRVLDILEAKSRHVTCDKCEGEDKGKPVLGLIVIKGLKKDDDEYNGGKILDPKTGKVYKCYITLEEKDKLKIRGYIGISLFGRTQYWHRVN